MELEEKKRLLAEIDESLKLIKFQQVEMKKNRREAYAAIDKKGPNVDMKKANEQIDYFSNRSKSLREKESKLSAERLQVERGINPYKKKEEKKEKVKEQKKVSNLDKFQERFEKERQKQIEREEQRRLRQKELEKQREKLRNQDEREY